MRDIDVKNLNNITVKEMETISKILRKLSKEEALEVLQEMRKLIEQTE